MLTTNKRYFKQSNQSSNNSGKRDIDDFYFNVDSDCLVPPSQLMAETVWAGLVYFVVAKIVIYSNLPPVKPGLDLGRSHSTTLLWAWRGDTIDITQSKYKYDFNLILEM